MQTWYKVEYLFTVDEHEFDPPPKVKSGVLRITRNAVETLPCNEKKLIQVVKTGFNQRRKTLRNSLKSLSDGNVDFSAPVFNKRPEQLGVAEFIELTLLFNHQADPV
jgi:16S rRNA (adenine1518-N6/adenine1519-N6)-dimethyltransferase